MAKNPVGRPRLLDSERKVAVQIMLHPDTLAALDKVVKARRKSSKLKTTRSQLAATLLNHVLLR